MLTMQKLIKKLTHNKRLTFAYYAYLMGAVSIYPLSNGHYNLAHTIDSPYLDGCAAPVPYSLRPLGNVSGCASPVSSYRLHHKLWFNEADNRTSLLPDTTFHKYAYSLEDTISTSIREFSYALTRRTGIWFYDMTGRWFDNPLLEKMFLKMNRIYDYANQRPIAFKSKVAVFFDEQTLYRTSLQARNASGNRIQSMKGNYRIGLGKAGTPYDTFLIDDIYKVDLNQYKCYILLNTWRRNEKLKKYLEEKVYKNGNMVVWIYAPGYSGNKLSLDNIRYMSGLNMGMCPKGTRLEVKTSFGNEGKGFITGTPGIIPNEVFYVKNKGAEVLGKYVQTAKPALALIKNQKYSTAYMAAPDDTGKVWNKLFSILGIHRFCDRNDRIYYDGDFIGIHFIDGNGKRTITLDRNTASVRDVFKDKQITVKKRRFEVYGTRGETKLFHLGNKSF